MTTETDIAQVSQTAEALGRDFQNLADALLKDVQQVLTEIPDDALNEVPAGLTNSPCTLIYHLLGSARYWIGEVVGGKPADRVRADEFQAHGSRRDLETRLEDTRARLTNTFVQLNEADLTPRPVDLSRGVLSWGELPPEGRTSVWVIVHDLAHMAYHLGQLKLIITKRAAEAK